MKLSESMEAAEQRQAESEEQSVRLGVERYRRGVERLEAAEQVADTDYGKRLVLNVVTPLSKAISEWVENAKRRAGRHHAALTYLELVDPDVAAYLTARAVFDSVLSSRTPYTQYVALSVARELRSELLLTELNTAEPKLYATIMDKLGRHAAGKQRAVRHSVCTHAIKKFTTISTTWPLAARLAVGTTLIDLLQTATGLIETEVVRDKLKTSNMLVPSEVLVKWIIESKGRSELLNPVYMPMVAPPKPWVSTVGGGYLSLRRAQDLVKSKSPGYLKELAARDLDQVYAAVNTLQETSWQVNLGVLNVVRQVQARGLAVGDLAGPEGIPIPPKPSKDSPLFAEWKTTAREIFIHNKRRLSYRVAAGRVVAIAESLVEEDKLWFPYQLDFRGRAYSIASHLMPQGTDLAKSLLRFAEGKPLGQTGAWWLAIHVANTFGVDKVSYVDRVKWTLENSDRIVAIATDPMSDLWWADADSPWMFVAACLEWGGYVRDGYDYVCNLPVSVDGSNNGLQHFAAMLRDEQCGSLVNLVPTEKPADVYQAVADIVVHRLKETVHGDDGNFAELAKSWIDYGVGRSTVKRPVMIVPYGGTRNGIRDYILDVFADDLKHPFRGRVGAAAGLLTDLTWSAMEEVMVGPRHAMKWLRDTAKTVAKHAAASQPISWSTPSGFLVQQAYYKISTKRVKTKLGDRFVRLTLTEENTKQIDQRRQVQSISPNFVHSMDAACLMLTVNAGKANGLNAFAAIHDSFGTHACDVEMLQACIREVFVQVYEQDILGRFGEEALLQIPDPDVKLPAVPQAGSLDLSAVRESSYFFA